MTKYEYDNYKYIFTAMDLFTKKAYAYPITNKDKAYIALNKLINDVKRPIRTIRSDRGSEYIEKKF